MDKLKRGNRRRADTTPESSPYATVHLALIGTEDSGKTELLAYYLNHRYAQSSNAPQDHILEVDDRNYPIQLVDTPNSHQDLERWCGWAECFILCYSVYSKESFESIIFLREYIRKASKASNPILICGTSFGVGERRVAYDAGRKRAAQIKYPFMEVSRNMAHIEEALRSTVRDAVQRRKQMRIANPYIGLEPKNATLGKEKTSVMDAKVQPKSADKRNNKAGGPKEEISSFERWDETLNQIASRVTQNPQQFENKGAVLMKFMKEECDYCNILNSAIKIFLRPLKTANPPILKSSHMQKIFRNIEVIVKHSIEFLALLEQLFNEWNFGTEAIGDVFEILDNIIAHYTNYLRNHISSMTCVNNLEKKNVQFADFLQNVNANKDAVQKKLDFISFLLLPVERLGKYERAVEALMGLTPSTHPDHAVLVAVAGSIHKAKNIIQAQKEENFQTVFAIQRSFVGDFVLAKATSYFQHDGGLFKVCKTGARKFRWFFLFNDLLVYAQHIPAPAELPSVPDVKNISSLSLQPYHGNVYVISRKLTLGIAFKIVDLQNSLGFKIISVEKTFVVYSPTAAEKKKWLEKFLVVLLEEQIIGEGRSESSYQLSAVERASVKVKQCGMCNSMVNEQKHYCCRNCGKVMCVACSTKRCRISDLGNDDTTVRVCDYCHKYFSTTLEEGPKSDQAQSQDAKQGDAQNQQKMESLVGYSLKKMRNVTQFVKRKTQVLKRKKHSPPNALSPPPPHLQRPLQFQDYRQFQPPGPEPAPPKTITISNPISFSAVGVSNPIINNFVPVQAMRVDTLRTLPIYTAINNANNANNNTSNTSNTTSPPASMQNGGGGGDHPRLSQEQALQFEQNKQRILRLNLEIQKRHRQPQPPASQPPPAPQPPHQPPSQPPPHPPSLPPQPPQPPPQLHMPIPIRPQPVSKPPAALRQPPPSQPPEHDMEKLSSSPDRKENGNAIVPRRFGVKLANEEDNPFVVGSALDHPIVKKAEFHSRPHPPAHPPPHPATKPIDIPHAPSSQHSQPQTQSPPDAVKPSTFPNATRSGPWKPPADARPAPPLSSSLQNQPKAPKASKPATPSRPLPPTPRDVISPTRELSDGNRNVVSPQRTFSPLPNPQHAFSPPPSNPQRAFSPPPNPQRAFSPPPPNSQRTFSPPPPSNAFNPANPQRALSPPPHEVVHDITPRRALSPRRGGEEGEDAQRPRNTRPVSPMKPQIMTYPNTYRRQESINANGHTSMVIKTDPQPPPNPILKKVQLQSGDKPAPPRRNFQ